MTEPVFFATPQKLNAWFRKNGTSRDELLVGFYKKGTGRPSVTWEQSVDEALCFGWIDGIRRRIDDDSYSIRFTPRRPKSIWSKRNIERVNVLVRKKRMRPAGMDARNRRSEDNSETYAYEQKIVELSKQYEARIRKNKKAWKFFESLTPSVKKPSIWWVCTAKKNETRERRLQTLIECCANEETLPQFLRPTKPRKKK